MIIIEINDLRKNKLILSALLLIALSMTISMKGFIFDDKINIFSIGISTFYVGLWLLLMHKGKESKDLLFFTLATNFWVLTTIVLFIGYLIYTIGYSGELYAPLAAVFVAPFYAIGEFLMPYGENKFYLLMAISSIIAFINYKNLEPLEIEMEKENIKDNLKNLY